jgi:hypothetical protein
MVWAHDTTSTGDEEVAVHLRRVTSRTDRLFFPLMGLTATAVVGAGFAPTYYLGFWFDAPALAPIVHVHAAAFTAWLLLLLSQILLIRLGRFRWHRAVGKVAIGLVVVMVITGYIVILGKPRPTASARAFIFTPMLSLLLFPMFVAAALHFRRDPATHKRLMLLATVVIATAGISRVMVMLGLDATHYRPYGVTYAVLLLPLFAFDLTRLGKLHRATAWGTALLLVRHPLHQAIANTDQWQRIAAWLTPAV